MKIWEEPARREASPRTELSASSLLGGRACISAYTIGHPIVSLSVRAVGIRVGGPVGCQCQLCQRSRKLYICQVPVGPLRVLLRMGRYASRAMRGGWRACGSRLQTSYMGMCSHLFLYVNQTRTAAR